MVQASKYVLFVAIVGTILYLASCTKDKAMEPGAAVSCIPDTYTVTYTADVKAILETYCGTLGNFGSCHQSIANGGIGFDYTTYDGIKLEFDLGTLENRVFVVKDMPFPGTLGPTTLSDCDKQKLQKWIDEGAPE